MALHAQVLLIILTLASLAIARTEGLEVTRPNCTMALIMPVETKGSYWETKEKIIFTSAEEAQKKKVSNMNQKTMI